MADELMFDDIPSFDQMPDAAGSQQSEPAGLRFDDIPDFDALPDNANTGRPAPETASGTALREAAHAAVPAGAGLVGAGLGGAAAGALGAGPVGAFVGGIGGMLIASYGAGAAQEAALNAAGFDDSEQRAANREENPKSAFAGGLIPSVATMSPAVAARAAGNQLPAAVQKVVGSGNLTEQAIQRGAGGVFMGAFEAGQEYLNEGHVDPTKAAAAFAVGAVAPSVNRVGAKFVGAGERLVPGRPNRTANPAADQAHADVADATADIEVGNSSLAQSPHVATGETTGNPQSAPERSSRAYGKDTQPVPAEDTLTQGQTDPATAAAIDAATSPAGVEAQPASAPAQPPANGIVSPNAAKPRLSLKPRPQEEAPAPGRMAEEPVVEAGIPQPGEPVAMGANDVTPLPPGTPERAAKAIARSKAKMAGDMQQFADGSYGNTGKGKGSLVFEEPAAKPMPELKGETPINDSITEAQRKAGNYPKATSHDFGKPLKVETHAGDVRRGKGPDGTDWEVTLPYDYGYFNKTKGADKDHIDFARPAKGSPEAGQKFYIIDQRNAETGKFDEHKLFTYYKDEAAARKHYLEGFSDGKGEQRLGAITEVKRPELVKFLQKHTGKSATKPYAMAEASPVPGQKKDVRERAVFKDLVAKKPEMAEALKGASDEAIAKAIEGKRVRKYGVGTGASAGYPVEGVFTSDGRPVTANTKAKAAERSAAHKKVADWFEKSAPKAENESRDDLMKRLLNGAPSIEGWKPTHKPKEWMLAREAQRFLQKPTPAAEKKFREAERLLRGAPEDVEAYRGGNRVEADIARSRRSGDEAVASAEAKNVDLGRNSVEDEMIAAIDARRKTVLDKYEADKAKLDAAFASGKDFPGVSDVLGSDWGAGDRGHGDPKSYKDAAYRALQRRKPKFDVPHEEAETMVKPEPVKTKADLKKLPRKTVDAADSSLAKIDTKAISKEALRKAEAAQLAGKKSEKAANVESEGAASEVRRPIKTIDQAESARLLEMLNKAHKKTSDPESHVFKDETLGRGRTPDNIKGLFDRFMDDTSGAVGAGRPQVDIAQLKQSFDNWVRGTFKRTEPKSYRAMTLKTDHDVYVQSLSDALQASKKEDENFFLKLMERMRALPPELQDTGNRAKIYAARDKDSAHFPLPAGQTGTHVDNLPPALKRAYDEHLKPILDMNDEFVKAIRAIDPDRIGPDVEHHISRITKGDSAQFDLLKRDDDPTSPAYSGMAVNAISARERKFYALVGADGRRHVISPTDTGFVKWDKYKREKIKDPTFEFEDGKTYMAGPNAYTMRQATTKEIMDNARGIDNKPMKYYSDAGFSAAVSNLQLAGMMRHLTTLHEITQSPQFQKLATRNKAKADKMEWKESNLPNMKGWFMHPELRAVFDDFAGQPQNSYRRLNSAITKMIFWMPVAHLANVETHWHVGRGWDWMTPAGYKSLAVDGYQAIKSVVNQDAFQHQMRSHGAGVIYGSVLGRRPIEQIGKVLQMDIEQNPSKWGPIADKLGVPLKAMGRAVYDTSAKVMWAGNDMFLTQRVMELMRKEGFKKFDGSVDTPEYRAAMKRAIIEAERDIPNYRIPHNMITRMHKNDDAAGRRMAQFMQDPAFTAFGRYHYGMFNSYANIIKDAVGKHAELGDRVDAVGKLLVMGSLAWLIYPVYDKFAKWVTGNEGAKAARRGPTTIPHHLAEAAEGKQDITSFARGTVTLPPLISAALGLYQNKDFRGKPIVEPGSLRQAFDGSPTAAGRSAVQLGEYAARSLVSPYSTFANVHQKEKGRDPGANPVASVAKAIRDAALDIKDPSEKAKRYERMIPVTSTRQDISRFRQGGSGPAEGLFNKWTGYR